MTTLRTWVWSAAAVLLMCLGSCSALPVIVPDMARSSTPVQIDSARGPLSNARSRAIVARLANGAGATHIFDRHLALEQSIVDSPLLAGNRVQLLQDGPSTYRAMLASIAAARDHIHMETYILDDDEVGRQFVQALLARQRQGVQVSLIYDSVGALNTSPALLQGLRDGGVRVLEFNPVNPLNAKVGWSVNQRDHRKLLIVDGRTAFLGGINISSVYSGGSFGKPGRLRADGKLPWRDTHLQLDGPVVAEFQKLFLETWRKQRGTPLGERNFFPRLLPQGDEVVRAIGSSPDDADSPIYRTLLSAINAAETEVLVTNAYFVPDAQLIAALTDAAARGVDVRLVLPGRTDSALVFHAGRASYDVLLRGGVRLFERQQALMHSKTALVDGVWSTVGSTNLDWRSFLHNDEVNAVVLGTAFGQRMRAVFEDDVAHSTEITLAQWQARGVTQRLKEAFSRLWQYWL